MPGPVYFISHGGPPTLFATEAPAHLAWKSVGQRILTDVESGTIAKDKGLICLSAHWENEETPRGVLYNTDPTNPLIYDFYNFPAHYYKQTFESHNSPGNLRDLVSALQKADIPSSGEPRGLDHGLWVPFKIFFPTPPTFPILQVTLPTPPPGIHPNGVGARAYAEEAVRLGRALHSLRDQGYGIVATGQPVHNLRAFMSSGGGVADKKPYDEFFKALREAATDPLPATPVMDLFTHKHYRLAHPTAEHLIPLAVAAGAAEGPRDQGQLLETGQRAEALFEMGDGPLGWWMGRWQ